MSDERQQPPGSIRATFAWDGSKVQIVDAEMTPRRPAPSDELDAEPMGDFWVELLSGVERIVYRRVLRNPLRRDIELFGPGGAAGYLAPDAEVVEFQPVQFRVEVPHRPDAMRMRLFGAELAAGGERRAAQDLGIYDLRTVGA